MKGVILDADSLGDVDIKPITSCLHQWDIYPAADVAERIRHTDIVLSNKVVLSKEVLTSAKNLAFISILATGTNNVDLIAASRLSIQVSNAIGYGTTSVVQHTINLMLCLATQSIRYTNDVKAGLWQKSPVFTRLDYPIVEISGKTLGIVGYGELGNHVAKIAQAFGMKVKVATSPNHQDDARVPLEDLLPSVNFLSLHCPLTDATLNIINKQTLALMPSHAFLINTAKRCPSKLPRPD